MKQCMKQCMKKSDVYSWRVDPDLKRAVEDAARTQHTSVSRLLDRIVSEWIADQSASRPEEDAQRNLHESAARAFGSIRGGDPHRSAQVRQRVRARLTRGRAG